MSVPRLRRRPLLLSLPLLLALGGASPAPQPASGQAVLAYLDQAIGWYRQQIAQAQLTTEPTDVVYAASARRQARAVLRLAFTFARAEVALLPEAKSQPSAPGAAPPGKGFDADRALASASAALTQAQGVAAALQAQLPHAARGDRALLEARLAAARSQVELAQARHDALAPLSAFLNRAENGGGGLLARVDELERSVPEASGADESGATAQGQAQSAAAAEGAVARRAAPNGLVALLSDLLALGRSIGQLHQGVELTTALRSSLDRLRAPLSAELRATLQAGAGADPTQATDPAALEQQAHDLEQVTARFKLVSAAMLPLGKAAALLGAHAALLGDWRASLDAQYASEARALLLRVGLLALGVALVLGASELWRRATLRYVHDPRRRQQSLLLRRILAGAAIVLMVAFSFVTELGSLATFAGFITAGLAVALQNVILSVVAYFFLIGRYGVRVGDRVQISGVDGDVIDIGLVRLHLLELRADGHPTGRVVEFSNAVLFQPTSSFFKQLPGSDYTWHQVVLTFAAGTDYRDAEKRLRGAVEGIVSRYRDALDRQHADVVRELSVAVRPPRPESQFRLTESGLEMTIRYPVPLANAPSIDDEVTRALLDAVEATPRLALAGAASPTLRAVPDGA